MLVHDAADHANLLVQHPGGHGDVKGVLVRWQGDDNTCCPINSGGNPILIIGGISLDIKQITYRFTAFDSLRIFFD